MAIISCIGIGMLVAGAHALLIKKKTSSTVMAGILVCVMGGAFGGFIGAVALAVPIDSWINPPLLVAALVGSVALLMVMTTIRRLVPRRGD